MCLHDDNGQILNHFHYRIIIWIPVPLGAFTSYIIVYIIYIRRTAYCFVFPSEYKYDVDADILFRGGNHLPSRRKNYFWKANSNFWGAKSVFAKDS